jgi:cytoplasmic iron level regulating protein YaaA (DUF328/UPF0246 family)
MKIVLSPAKSLNFEKELPTALHTEPLFLKESREVHKVLKEKTCGFIRSNEYFR